MDDNLLSSNDPDEFPEDYYEKLEEKLLEDDDPERKFAPDSGRSVFEIERLKRKKQEDSAEE